MLPVLAICVSALACSPLVAQNRGGGGFAAPLLAAAADADRSGDVTAEEWAAFLSALGAGDDGRIDPRTAKALLLVPSLDADRDGALTAQDLRSWFERRDRDGDGALAADELGGGRRGRGTAGFAVRVLFLGADRDGDGAVSADEWRALLRSAAGDGGAVSTDAVGAWIDAAERSVPADAAPGAFTPGVFLLTLASQLDADGDGNLSRADLESAFAALDGDGDGALAQAEIAASRGRQRQGGGGWAQPTEAQRQLPPLMPWQRNLDDALALVELTGKPLLICVNMDGEPASESIAWIHYRDPEFAKLADGFIPVLASPDQRNPRDHDDAGRRIPDGKFGRLINAEHISIEPILFERYFGDQRVAPRHLAVDPSGETLFDIYLVNDFSSIERAMREHGRPDRRGPQPPVDELDERALLASPDAACRDRLEQLFADGDEETRARLADAALSDTRRTQHPEILRMALRDPRPRVHLEAVRAIAQHAERAPVELLPAAFRAATGDPAQTALLVDGLQSIALGAEDEAARARARRLQRVFAGLELQSAILDPGRWRLALELAPRVTEVAPSPDQLDELDRGLDELDRRRAADPDDRTLDLQVAAMTLRYARIRILTGNDPTFMLEDVRRAASRATSVAAPSGRALALMTVASHLLNEPDAAAGYATEALPHLIGDAGSPLAAEVLAIFARSRTQALYAAMGSGDEWPAHWIADTRAAYETLLEHPACTEEHVTQYADWLGVLEAYGLQEQALKRGLDRFPLSGAIHERLRAQMLRDHGADALEAAYDAIEPRPEDRATLSWFAGVASLVAAEQHVRNDVAQAALATYERAIEELRSSIDLNPEFRGSAAHYICLAAAGRARVLAETGKLADAVSALLRGIAASPGTAAMADGLGNTPTDTAILLRSEARDAGQDAEAQRIEIAMERLGIALPEPRRRGGGD